MVPLQTALEVMVAPLSALISPPSLVTWMGEVMALANRLKAPVLTTFKAKGQLPDGHPLAAGVLEGLLALS